MSDVPPYPPQPPPPPGGWGDPQYAGPPDPASYDATQAIGYGWKAFQANAGPLLVAGLLAMIVPGVIQGMGNVVGGGEVFALSVSGGEVDFDFSPVAFIFNIVAAIGSLMLSAGVIRLAFDVVDGREVSIGGMFNRIDFVQVVVAAIIVGVLMAIGLALCILPGFVVLFLTYLTNYFIVDKGEDAITAIKSSVSLITSNMGSMLLLALLSICVMVLGVIACLVGLLVAYPVVTVAAAFTFRYLQREPIRPLQ